MSKLRLSRAVQRVGEGGYHCLRVSDEVFERLLQRDPDANIAVAKLVYSTPLSLDDPGEAALTYGFLSNRTYNRCFSYWGSANFKTIRELLDLEHPERLKGIGKKGLDEIQALRRHFKYKLRVGRRESPVKELATT